MHSSARVFVGPKFVEGGLITEFVPVKATRGCLSVMTVLLVMQFRGTTLVYCSPPSQLTRTLCVALSTTSSFVA